MRGSRWEVCAGGGCEQKLEVASEKRLMGHMFNFTFDLSEWPDQMIFSVTVEAQQHNFTAKVEIT